MTYIRLRGHTKTYIANIEGLLRILMIKKLKKLNMNILTIATGSGKLQSNTTEN